MLLSFATTFNMSNFTKNIAIYCEQDLFSKFASAGCFEPVNSVLVVN